MRKFQSLALAVLAGVSLGAMAQQGPVLFYGIMELSGTGATPGNNFDNGVKLAVKGNQCNWRYPRPQDQLRFYGHPDQSGRRKGDEPKAIDEARTSFLAQSTQGR